MISENQGILQPQSLFPQNGQNQTSPIIIDLESETTQSQSQQDQPIIKKNKENKGNKIKQLQMIDELVKEDPLEIQEMRGYEWIQSTNKEDFEVMKNVCYLEQFIDLYDDFDKNELIHLDIPQFLQYMGNSGSESSSILSDDEELDDQFEENLMNNEGDMVGFDITKPLKKLMCDEQGISKQNDNAVEVLSQNGQAGGDDQQAIKNKNMGNLKLKGRNLMSQSSFESQKDDDIFSQINQKGNTKRYQTSLALLAQEQFIRISKYGDVALTSNIARKNPKTDDFYDQEDSFIDDDQVDTELKQLAICEADYDDFFMVEGMAQQKAIMGGMQELVKSAEFKDRLKDIQEYRDTKKLEIHLRTDKKEEKPKPKKSKSLKEAEEKPKMKSLLDNDEDDDKDVKKKKKNAGKNKGNKIDNLHLKQPTFKEGDEIDEKSQNKKMIPEDNKVNDPQVQKNVNSKNARKSGQNKEPASVSQPINKKQNKSIGTNNQNQPNKEEGVKQKANKNNKKVSIQKKNEEINKPKEIISIPSSIEQQEKFIIIDDDKKNKTDQKNGKNRESSGTHKKLSIQQDKKQMMESESTPNKRPSSDKFNNKSNISINLTSSKKINENSNQIPLSLQSLNIVKKPQMKDTLSQDGDQDKYVKTRSQRNEEKANSIRDNESISSLLDTSQINRGRISNQNASQQNSINFQQIVDKTQKRKAKSISSKQPSANVEDTTSQSNLQFKEESQNKAAKRSLSLVNSNKVFLDEQPLDHRNSKGDVITQKGKRKIINPNKRDQVDMIDENTKRNSNSQVPNQQKSDVAQTQPGTTQYTDEAIQKIKAMKKKIIKTDKRKREKDIPEEANIIMLKKDKKIKE